MNNFEALLLHVAVFILSFGGYFVARHIYNHKKQSKPLVCPIRFDCNSVVTSDYSKFLGIPLEVLGMNYYAVVSILYFILIFTFSMAPIWVLGTMILSSVVAFLFSVYLICIQLFVLRKGCSWCFVSAGICILIFILNLLTYNLSSLF